MSLTRREFFKLCGISAAGLGISQLCIPEVLAALEKAAAGNPPVIWIQGAGDDGCLVSLLNTAHPTIAEVLLKIISLQYNPTIMAASGKTAISHLDTVSEKEKGKFILVVEGAIPTKDNGLYCTIGQRDGKHITILETLKNLAPKAKAIIALGACAACGGVSAGKPNPTEAKSVTDILGKNAGVINIPGCPAHPDWLVGTLVHLLMYGPPQLDEQGRPKMFFSDTIHQNCPNYSYYIDNVFASKFGEKGCLIQLGCKGPVTSSDCPTRRWNSKVEWCIGAGAPCIGCCSMEFLDGLTPFYTALPEPLWPKKQTELA
jgi:hydrogenase small subunit